jgi:Skp family chaperone for outer membrane proteins
MRIPAYLALSLAVLAVVALPQDKEKPKPKAKSPILIVNILRIKDDTDEGRELVTRLNQEMAAEKQRLTDEAMKLQEKIKQLREAKLADRTQEYYKELEVAMGTQARLEMDKQLFLARKGDELSRAMQQLLIGAMEEARGVMKERGAEIVLASKTGPFEITTDQQFQEELVMRRVICCTDDVDITNEVIERMNAWYKNNKSGQGPPKREEGAKEGEKKETASKGE